MTPWLLVIVFSCLARQVDRLWFTMGGICGNHAQRTLPEIVRLQRERMNNWTPAILIIAHWSELLAWCALLGPQGAIANLVLVLVAAVKFRHMQEVTHFAVHGVLARNRTWGDLLAECLFQSPLLLEKVAQRRTVHVREHHPNATVAQTDPNQRALVEAGVRAGASKGVMLRGLIFPLTPTGLLATLRSAAKAAQGALASADFGRLAAPLVVGCACYAASGGSGLVYGLILPRLLVYPMLAWLSLLVEHRWLDAVLRTGIPLLVESGRCVRLYRRQWLWLAVARATWLPYGDAFHFAHSVHPAIRWNYLKRVDNLLTADVLERRSVVFRRDSIIGTLYRKAAHG